MSRYVFGIHSVTPYRRTDGTPYGILKVLGGGNLELTGETEDLFGGSSKYAYASEATQVGAQMTLNVKSYPDFLMELFLGGSVTAITAAANGEVRNTANKSGDSVIDASTGIGTVSITSGDEADAKAGRYVIKAVSATEVDVYLLTDIDFNRGTKGSYLDNALKIAEDVLIETSSASDLSGYGIDLNGGSGTIGFTTDDTAIFDVLPAHSGGSSILIGSETSEFPAFGAIMLANKRSTGEIFQLEAYNCIGSGMPFPLQEKAWMISDLTVKVLRDEDEDAVMKITAFDEV